MPPGARQGQFGGATMGSSWSVQALLPADCDEVALQRDIAALLDELIRQMSTWDPASELCRFNRAAAGSVHQLPTHLCQVLAQALYVAQQSGGAYDPTAGKLVDLWGFGPQPRRSTPPSAAEIAAARSGPGWRSLEFSALAQRACQAGGIALDLSAIAKGYAVDQLSELLSARDIAHHLVEIGGELRGAGVKQDGQPWWVEIATRAPTELAPLVALYQMAIATSGNELQYFEHARRRYSHTIDPRSGWPVDNALRSVSVLHRSCMSADALATAFMVMGPSAALAYAEQHQIALLLRADDDSLSASKALRAMLT